MFVLVSVTVCTTFGDTSLVSLLASTYLIVRVITFVSTSSSFACGYFTTTSVSSIVGVTSTNDTLSLSGVPYFSTVGETCSFQLPGVHVPSSSVFVTLFRLFVLVSVTVCTTFGDTSLVSLLASTYLIVRVITFVSTSSSFACGYFTTTSVFSIVDVTDTEATLSLSGVP